MNIPKWLKSYLKSEDIEKITQAIKNAEKSTAGEIVPMIVNRSSTVGHVPVLIFTLLTALFFMLNGFEHQAKLIGGQWFWYLADIALILILTAIFSRFPCLQRLLTPHADQALQVNARSIIEFYESNIQNTRDATGILIFISMFEHRAVVLADKAINEKVDKNTWNNICDDLITGIKQKKLGKAISEAVLECGKIMEPHFPIQPDDTNELKDQLIIKY